MLIPDHCLSIYFAVFSSFLLLLGLFLTQNFNAYLQLTSHMLPHLARSPVKCFIFRTKAAQIGMFVLHIFCNILYYFCDSYH